MLIAHIFFLQWCCINNRIYISLPLEIFLVCWCWTTSDTNMQDDYYKNDYIIVNVLYISHNIVTFGIDSHPVINHIWTCPCVFHTGDAFKRSTAC